MNAQTLKSVVPDAADYIKDGIRAIINTGELVSSSKAPFTYRIPAVGKTVLCRLNNDDETIAYKEFATDRPVPLIWTTITIPEFVSKFLLLKPITFQMISTLKPQKPEILRGIRKQFSVRFQNSACPCFMRDGDLWGKAASRWFVFKNFVPWAVIGESRDVVVMLLDAFDRAKPQFSDSISWYVLFKAIVKEAKATFI